MTEILTQEQKKNVLQKVQLLNNSHQRQQIFYEMLHDKDQNKTAIIAFDNLNHQKMIKIYQKIEENEQSQVNILPGHSEINQPFRQCFLSTVSAQLIYIKQNTVKNIKKIQTIMSQAGQQIILLVLYIVAFNLVFYENRFFTLLFRSCNNNQSNIHQQFLLRTIWYRYPVDIALQEISCMTTPIYGYLRLYQQLLRFAYFVQPYVYVCGLLYYLFHFGRRVINYIFCWKIKKQYNNLKKVLIQKKQYNRTLRIVQQ